MTVLELIAKIDKPDEQIAVRLGVSAQAVAKWRKGRAVPIRALRAQLCRLAGLLPDDVAWEAQSQ